MCETLPVHGVTFRRTVQSANSPILLQQVAKLLWFLQDKLSFVRSCQDALPGMSAIKGLLSNADHVRWYATDINNSSLFIRFPELLQLSAVQGLLELVNGRNGLLLLLGGFHHFQCANRA